MNCFPLFNTVLLVYSGLFLMNSLSYLKQGNFFLSYVNTVLCIILGSFFVLVQFKEYTDSYFSFNDSCYGSIFFLLTGFHGFHVIIGLIFLLVCAYRLYLTYKFVPDFDKSNCESRFIIAIYILNFINKDLKEINEISLSNYFKFNDSFLKKNIDNDKKNVIATKLFNSNPFYFFLSIL